LGTLFQYLSGVNIGIDQLFMEHYVTVLSPHPGRMAPNTALCFLISGMAILLSSSASNTSTAKIILGISGSMVLGLGTIALFGYIAEIETVYGWGRLTRMAIHTSAGFIVLGSALLLLGWPRDTDQKGLPTWAPISSGLFSSALILSLWQALHPNQNLAASAFGHDVLLLLGLILSGGIMWLIRLSMKLQDRAFEAENNATFLLEAKNREKVNHEILEKLSTLQQEFIGESNTAESFAKLLDHILDVTESEYGFIGEVIDDDVPYLKTHAITDIAWNEETKKMYEESIGVGMNFYNMDTLFGAVVKTGKVVIANDVASDSRAGGRPEGHPSLDTFLGLPFFYAGKLLGMVGLANRKGGYDEDLLDLLAPITLTCGSFLDSQRVKKLEERVQKEDIKTENLERIGFLAAGVAHDFNNLLTAIFGNVSLAASSLDESSPAKKYLGEAENAMNRASQLSHRLLTFAKGGSLAKEVVALNDLIKNTTEFYATGSSIELAFEFGSKVTLVNADHKQLEQVFSNLTVNAVESMGENGRLTVSIKEIDARNVATIPQKEGMYAAIEFRDTGSGISLEDRQHIFDIYFSTKESGSGLGLATAYSIVKKHQGFLDAESEVGKGSAFTIYLPSTTLKPPIATILPEEAAPSVQKHSKRVLIMDDEMSIRDLLNDVLSSAGYLVDEASEGIEAVSKYSQSLESGHAYDCVVMDLTIRDGMGGRETIGELLKIDPNAKVIVASGYGADPIMENYQNYGFSAAIEKPFSLEPFIELIGKISST
jgi:signal transduction histidine kinase/CheY-like chemotaxis protein